MKYCFIIIVIFLISSCKKEKKTEFVSLTGKIKILDMHYMDTSGNLHSLPYIFKYKEDGFLYQVRIGDPDSVYYNITVDQDSNLMLYNRAHTYGFTIFQRHHIIDSIQILEDSVQSLFYYFLRDSVMGEQLFSLDPVFSFGLNGLIRNDSGYTQSTLTYPDFPFNITNYANYTFLDKLNDNNVPYQFPYDGLGESGYLLAELRAADPPILFLAQLNGYKSFLFSNKYLISSVNGYSYQYSFNTQGQVTEIHSNYLLASHKWFTIEYYE